ncbi:MAG: glycosyltransferase [Holosporaceae bacterium]|jgi:glycosyltransferase involved in cell wall biosynthesis|nr:glycosyltransferase [Holosporaceae bacterium]
MGNQKATVTLVAAAQPKISVIIPVYNAENFIERCLDSVTNQTLSQLEILCINDGSTDNSLRILEKYACRDSRITVINQENFGPGAARNAGLAAASGEYLGFVDSDDWIGENFFEKLYEIAHTYEADVAATNIIRAYPSGRRRNKVTVRENNVYSSISDKFAVTQTPRMCYIYNKIYKADFIRKLNITFRAGVCFEDIDFSVRALFFAKRLATTSEAIYYYAVNKLSMTRSKETDKIVRDLLLSREIITDFAEKHGVYFDNKYQMKRKIRYSLLGICLLEIHEWNTAKKFYLFGSILFFEIKQSL